MRITGTCHIRHRKVIVNNAMVYHRTEGNLDHFLENAYEHFKINYPRFYKMDRLSKIGFLAAEMILGNENMQQYEAEQKNMVLSNASASLDTDLRYADSAKTFASPALFVYTLPNIVAGEICIRHNIKGENAFFISKTFDAGLMEFYASSVLDHSVNEAQPDSSRCCLVGWVDLLQEHHDVFLYLVENVAHGMEHSAAIITDLYHTDLWNY